MRIRSSRGWTRSGGIVLIMALILLILISFLAALAVRHAVSGEQVSKAFRTSTVAFQVAETALRFCEDQVLRNGTVASGTKTQDPHPYPPDGSAPELWRNRANWEPAAGKAVEIDIRTAYSDGAAARSLEVLPRCMVERLRLNSEEGARREAFLVTAVGFSPDYRKESGKPDSGGEIWLQSMVSR